MLVNFGDTRATGCKTPELKNCMNQFIIQIYIMNVEQCAGAGTDGTQLDTEITAKKAVHSLQQT
jgi:hypothetical protein